MLSWFCAWISNSILFEPGLPRAGGTRTRTGKLRVLAPGTSAIDSDATSIPSIPRTWIR